MILNLGLLGGLIYSRADRPKVDSASIPPIRAAIPPPAGEVSAPAARLRPRQEPLPFRWSQLDAPDYHIYVKNLRASGCPESTVRAIVTADVHAAYHAMNNDLEKRISELAGTPGSVSPGAFNTVVALKSELQNLSGQEAGQIADYLGLTPAPVQLVATAASSPAPVTDDKLDLNAAPVQVAAAAGASPSPLTGDSEELQPEHPVVMPLVFQSVNLAALGLPEGQMQTIENLRKSFVEKVGGTEQNPSDPAYLAVWQQNQPLFDNHLLYVLGRPKYFEYQLQTAQNHQP